MGISATSVKGTYIETQDDGTKKEIPSEMSYFVCNQDVEGDDGGQLEKTLSAIGKRFDQDSVLIVPHGGDSAFLLGTTRRPSDIPYGRKFQVGKGSAFGRVAHQFLSRVRGRPFGFGTPTKMDPTLDSKDTNVKKK
jgi:hypothetical protein